MKRISKLLALVLTLCTVLSLTMLFASAETTNQLDASTLVPSGSGVKNLEYSNTGFGGGGSGGAVSIFYFESQNKNGNTYTRYRKRKTLAVNGVTYDLTTQQGAIGAGLANTSGFLNAPKGESVSFKTADYDYVVLSVDFMSDTVDENGKLNYLDKVWISTYAPYAYQIYFVSDSSGNWYLSTDNVYSSDDVPLSGIAGAWNNLSVVYDSQIAYYFVNGQFLGTKSSTTAVNVDRFILNFTNVKDYAAEFSICFDQFNVNTYGTATTPYVSADYVGLDDFIKDQLYKEKSLSTLSDVVFNKNYNFPPSNAEYDIKATVGGVEKSFDNLGEFGEIIPSLKAGDTIITDFDVSGMLKNAGIDFVKGKSGNQYRFTVADLPSSENESIVDGDMTTLTKINEETTIGKDLTMKGSHNDYNFVNNTVYTGNAGNVNFHGYFSIPGKINNASDRNNYPKSDKYRYAVLDFDVSADKYIYIPDKNADGVINADDGTVYSIVDTLDGLTDCEKATAKLSYYDQAWMASMANGSGWLNQVYYVSDAEGNWYISTARAYSADGVNAPLYDEVGEKNHITFIYDLVAGKMHLFVNDNHLNTVTTNKNDIHRFAYFGIQGAPYSPCSVLVTNVETTYYAKDYESKDTSVVGLDDYLSGGKLSDYSISFVDDIFANATFWNDDPQIKLNTRDGEFYYSNIAAAIAVAQTGDTLYYDGDLNLYDFIPTNIETLNINANSVTIVDGTNAALIHTYDATNKTLNRKNIYFVNWYNENGEAVSEAVSTDSLPRLSDVIIVTGIKGNYNQASAWKWALDGSEEYKPYSALTAQSVGATVNIYPVSANVTWKDGKNAETVITEPWFVGSVCENDFAGHEDISLDNGWYTLVYYWTEGGEAAKNFTVGADGREFTSLIKPVEAFKLSDLKINFTLNARYVINYYVPTTDLAGVEVTGARFGNNINGDKCGEKGYYDEMSESAVEGNISTTSIPSKTVTVGDKEYYKFVGTVFTSYAWYTNSGFEVLYSVEYEGKTYDLSSKVAVVMLGSKTQQAHYISYFNTVMNNSPCGSEDKVLLLNWMRYMNFTYIAASETHKELITTYKDHYECCGIEKSVSEAIPKTEPTLKAPEFKEGFDSTGISSSYLVNATYGLLQITLPKAFVDEHTDAQGNCSVKVTTTLRGINSETGEYGDVTYALTKTEDTTTVDGVKCYYFRITTSAGVYNVNAVHNITIKCGDEVVGTAQYSLARYLYKMNETFGTYIYDKETDSYIAGTDAKDINDYCMEIAMALSLYGEAAFEYKTEVRTAE